MLHNTENVGHLGSRVRQQQGKQGVYFVIGAEHSLHLDDISNISYANGVDDDDLLRVVLAEREAIFEKSSSSPA